MSGVGHKIHGVRVREVAVRAQGRAALEITPEAEAATSARCSSPPSLPPPLTTANTGRELLLSLLSSQSWKSRKSSLKSLKQIDVSAFNEEAEQMFISLCGAGAGLSARDIIAAAANALDISVETSKRYLMKHSAIGGSLTVSGGKVEKNV